jgi:hypothetical protein
MGTKLSDKYVAGFLDADGSIQIAWRKVDRPDSNKELRRAYISLEFSQDKKRSDILTGIQESIGGVIDESRGYLRLRLFGDKAKSILNRIRQHLVIKRHYAEICLDMSGKTFNKREAAKMVKDERKNKSLPLPNFPSRKWLAGYADGDGCFHIRLPKGRTSAQPVFEVVCSDFDSEGVEIIQKNFGGSIHSFRGNLLKYTLTLPPSKAIQFLEPFAKHMVAKKNEAMLILSHARMGHYREGKNIHDEMRKLKSAPAQTE